MVSIAHVILPELAQRMHALLLGGLDQMSNESLRFVPIESAPELVSISVAECIRVWRGAVPTKELLVAEIDPAAAGGYEFCTRYGYQHTEGANCVVIEATRGDVSKIAACLVPVGCRMDLGGFVRRHLKARRVSLASKDFVLKETGMEYGSITPFGLPTDWFILVDSTIAATPRVIVGGGLRKSKLSVPGAALLELPNAESIDGLGIREANAEP
jgi:prolyl-tRNA editing enzyme YbaK/EbsC (Cys-tRNA(Pro) deacylase)